MRHRLEGLVITNIAHHHKNNLIAIIYAFAIITSYRANRDDKGDGEMGKTARTSWAEKHLAGRYEHDQIVEMAVSELNAQIDLGHEYPDSCVLVAGKYGISTSELTTAYDDQF